MGDSYSQLPRLSQNLNWRTLSPLEHQYSESFRYVNGQRTFFCGKLIGVKKTPDAKLPDVSHGWQKTLLLPALVAVTRVAVRCFGANVSELMPSIRVPRNVENGASRFRGIWGPNIVDHHWLTSK
jgi:hypothetical protein